MTRKINIGGIMIKFTIFAKDGAIEFIGNIHRRIANKGIFVL